MELLFTYLCKSAISISLFYLLYAIVFRSDTFFELKRFYFLFVAIFSLVFPLISFELGQKPEVIDIPLYWMQAVDFTVTSEAVEASSFDWQNLLFICLCIGSGAMLTRFVFQFTSLLSILYKANKSYNKTQYYYETDNLPTFSFFNRIVVNTKGLTSSEIEDIVAHEQLHAKQWHSIDVLVFEVISICMWWNPFIWMLRKEMKLNLEYLADESVQKLKREKVSYQHLLLKINANTGVAFVNNFNVSQLKKRIAMMNRNRTLSILGAKMFLTIPLACFILFGNALYATPELLEENLSKIEESFVFETSQKSAKTQEKKTTEKKVVKFTEPEITPDKSAQIYTMVETLPRFTGGEEAMMKFLSENIKYPAEARDNNVEGRVVVRFVVSAEGDVKDTKVIRSLSPACDKEAVRVVNIMPKWVPGKQSGKVVSVYYTLPITFRLDSKKVNDNASKQGSISLDGKNILFLTSEGKELTEGEMKSLDSNRIEKIEVVKDESMKKYTTKDYDGVVIISFK